MNTAPATEAPTTQEQAPPKTERSIIAARIREAKMQMSTKKLAGKLLEFNLLVGDKFALKIKEIRKMCHAATNMEVTHHLRNMRDAKLIEFTYDKSVTNAEIRFLV